ncbi:two-component regulator propeller domain-containing protein [Ferruginibacter paludis]|uniref:ligand-binding sensor domain-containing protein n=1 Tax=Ferruginibacter paludis TaxID=1310417 RepID=UPI0025B4EC36|nr:two-component regulator propeller domain-containing protein [Ferruginibacter paludis]MDN3657419.1 two-component regulator propeller domain-containing protein [Ferruginibacter paludis]
MIKLQVILCAVFQVCCLLMHAQNQPIHFDHLGTDAGLSHSNALCITQDRQGFMWFGTWEGLNKYDGYTFKVYKNDPLNNNSISDNFISDFAKSKNGDLWIGTGNGFCRYNSSSEQFTRYQHNAANKNSPGGIGVNTLLEDHLGKVWIGYDAGLDLFDPVKNTFEHFTHDPNDAGSIGAPYVNYVFEDSRDNIWICTSNGGLNLFNRTSRKFTRFTYDKKNSHSISTNVVTTMFEDSRHQLWVGTDGGGLNLLDPSTGSFTRFLHDENNTGTIPSNVVSNITEDGDTNLWIATGTGGVCIFNYAKKTFLTYAHDKINRESISDNSINAVYRDTKSNMWIGTFANGVDLVDRDKTRFTHFAQMMSDKGISNNEVLGIFEDSKKNIWISTDGGGLNIYNPANGSFSHLQHIKNNPQSICGDNVLSACEDAEGNIWIGTWAEGVSVYNPLTKKFRHYKNDTANAGSLSSNNAWTILKDRNNRIWIGTSGGGLNLLNADGKTFTRYQYDAKNPDCILNNFIAHVFEDSDGDLYVSTNGGGLNVLNKKTGKFTHYLHSDTENSISNNNLNSVYEDSEKNIWIGTKNGLNKFNKKTKTFTAYTITDGLPDNVIFGILENNNKNLWISTNKGISCFSPAKGTFKNYDVSDGLQSNEFKGQAFCKTSSGVMYFGGFNGLTQFFPDSIQSIPFDPPLAITSFQVFNKAVAIAVDKNDPSPLKQSISETKSITLPYSSSVFSFEFASLNYTTGPKKRYAYMLENFDKDWNNAGPSRIATYTNLDPGTYIFKVKGLNNEGKWSANTVSIQLIINPPFWLTWWFKMITILAFTAVVILFYRWRVRTINAQKENLQKLVNMQTIELTRSNELEHKARVEAEVARAESEMARQETFAANEALQIKNRELEQFAYVASHDLQEPLRTTAGFVQLLEKQYQGKLDERADKYLRFISDASGRMKQLISDLLEFSRIGNNKKLQIVDCNIIVENVLADISLITRETGAVIQHDQLPQLIGYSSEMKALFQNLIINGIKFRRPGVSAQIKVYAERKSSHWLFAVKDNGIGIEPQYQERIFEIFQRLHTRSEYEGSGIGLSHCKKIIELHRGKIWVESAAGEGSTFFFTIPFLTKNEGE